jgi:hypothetical protein
MAPLPQRRACALATALRTIIFPWLTVGKGALYPGKEKNHFDCCFFLSFLGMYACTLLFFGLLCCPSRCVIMFLAPLILQLRAHTEKRKKGGRVHCLLLTRAHQNLCQGSSAHRFRAESFLAFWYYDTVLMVI